MGTFINRGNIEFRDIVSHEYVDKTSLIPLINARLNSESQQLYTALKILGKEVEYVQVDGENHVIVDYKKRMAWQQVIFAWFAKHLKNDDAWWKSLKL